MATDSKEGTMKSSPTAPGPYTPERVPLDTGNKSGGEVNWERSSATPTKK